jgi:hypothetical protein
MSLEMADFVAKVGELEQGASALVFLGAVEAWS